MKKSNKHKKKKQAEPIVARPDMCVLAKEVNDYYRDDRGDGGPYSGYTEEHVTVTPYSLHRDMQNNTDTNTVMSFLKDHAKAFSGYVMWVIYGDGGTFGHRSGMAEYIGVFDTEEECRAIKEAIEKGGGGQGGDARPYKEFMKKAYGYEPYKGWLKSQYASWVGYFSSLEGIEWQRFIIQ